MAEKILYRIPSIEDDADIWKMADEAAALDDNSSYAYFMACRNFAATSVVAEVSGEVAGMVTAYPLPADPSRLFIWQVGVRDAMRGRGLARGMLEALLSREECAAVRWIEATIAPGNEAPEALFRRIADQLNTEMRATEVYKDELFPDAEHKVEKLFVIGPITRIANQIHIRYEDGAYRLYAMLEGNENPAFEPINPVFGSLDDATRAADDVRDAYAAKEVVIVADPDHV